MSRDLLGLDVIVGAKRPSRGAFKTYTTSADYEPRPRKGWSQAWSIGADAFPLQSAVETMTLATAGVTFPVEVQRKVNKAKTAAEQARTPAQVQEAAALVEDATAAINEHKATVGWWSLPLWSGTTIKRWQGFAIGGGVLVLLGGLIPLLRRSR